MNKFRLISIDQFWTTFNGSCFQFDYKKTKNEKYIQEIKICNENNF